MSETMPAPANLEDGYLLYLAALRETGIAHMFDARVSLDAKIDVIRRETTDILARWMWTFADEQPHS